MAKNTERMIIMQGTYYYSVVCLDRIIVGGGVGVIDFTIIAQLSLCHKSSVNKFDKFDKRIYSFLGPFLYIFGDT